MRLAYSSNAFTATDLTAALRAIAALGYGGAEILCDRPHWFGDAGSADAAELRAVLAETGLAVSNLNANTTNGYYRPAPPENVFEPAMSNPDPDLRRWREDYTIGALRLAAELDAPCVSVTSGQPRAGVEPERSLDWLAESLRRVCTEAEKLGRKVGIEYEPGLLLERAGEVREMIDRVGSPALGVNLDIGHSYLDGEDPAQAIALLAGRIWNVHVEDIRARKHFHRVPGDGDLPFEVYFRALAEHGYDGFLTVELYSYVHQPERAGAAALAFLQPLLRKLNLAS